MFFIPAFRLIPVHGVLFLLHFVDISHVWRAFFFCWRLVFPFMFFLHPDLRMQPSTGFVNTVDVLRMD